MTNNGKKNNLKSRPNTAKYTGKYEYILLFAIFLFACFVRIYKLGSLPHGFYVEEMTNTYIGRFILLHGKDVYGNMFPIFYFNKFGDYPPVLPFYLSGLSTFIFGVNEFAGRFPIALIGAMTVFPLYAFVKQITKSIRAGLMSIFLLAVTPWTVVLSRTTSEGIPGLFLYICGLYFLMKGYIEQNKGLLYSTCLLFILSYFIYPSYRIIVPLSLFPFVIYGFSHKNSTYKLITGITSICLFLTVVIASTSWGQARLKQTGLFTNPETVAQISDKSRTLADQLGPGHILRARIFHNKIVIISRIFLTQYLSYFSPQYLFLQSGGQYRYFNVPEQGLVFLSIIPLLISACFWSQGRDSYKKRMFVLYLLAVAPVAAAVTTDFSPHAHRSLTMIFPLLVLSGMGFEGLIQIFGRPKSIGIIILALAVIESVYFWNQYAYHADKTDSIFRNDGDREAVLYIQSLKKNYRQIIAPVYERFPLYYAFYTKHFGTEMIGKFGIEMKINRIDNVLFVESECPTKTHSKPLTEEALIIDNGKCPVIPGYKILTVIRRSDDSPAYRFSESIR